jgi:hypothetical protein
MTPAPDPHAQVVALQARLDEAELPWQASVIGQHGETTFCASRRASNRQVVHPHADTVFDLVVEAEARIAPKPVEVRAGLMGTS